MYDFIKILGSRVYKLMICVEIEKIKNLYHFHSCIM